MAVNNFICLNRRAEGLEERVGHFGRRVSVADAIDELQGGTGAGAPAAQIAPAK